MKIIRITGDIGMGKTTYLRTLQRSSDTDFIDLTNCSVRTVSAALARISRDPSEMRMTVLIDDCRPEVEAILRSAKCGNAVAVIVGVATESVWSGSGGGHVPIKPATLAMVHDAAQRLVELANLAGFVVTIERRPLQPLAMGNAEYVIETRPARGGQ